MQFFFVFRYDYFSIMHYNQYAFSKNIGGISIVPLDPNIKGSDLGQRSGFTETDVDQIKAAYVSDFITFLFCIWLIQCGITLSRTRKGSKNAFDIERSWS